MTLAKQISQLSTVDWGDINSSWRNSVMTFGFGGHDSHASGNSMASAAAAVAASLEDGDETSYEEKDDRYTATRYDPKAMNRITDINDLADCEGYSESDAESSSEEQAMYGECIARKKRGGISYPCQRALLIMASIGIILAASFGIRAVVMNNKSNGPQQHSSTASFQVDQQYLMRTAERIVLVCSESSLDESIDECRSMCQSRMCCFERGQYSCESDESKNCAVYSGCEALVERI